MAFKNANESLNRSELGPCRHYAGRRDENGYGRTYHAGKDCLAHRKAWIKANGPIPPGLHVLHKCDNPPCIRVRHLFLGTHQDNMRDMAAKGRAHKETHHSPATRAKLSARLSGRVNGPLPESTKQKMRQAALGRKASPEHKRSISLALAGRTLSQAHKNSISQGMKRSTSCKTH